MPGVGVLAHRIIAFAHWGAWQPLFSTCTIAGYAADLAATLYKLYHRFGADKSRLWTGV